MQRTGAGDAAGRFSTSVKVIERSRDHGRAQRSGTLVALVGAAVLVLGALLNVLVPGIPELSTAAADGDAVAGIGDVALRVLKLVAIPVGTAMLAAGIVVRLLSGRQTRG